MSILPRPLHVAIAVPMADGMTNAGMLTFPAIATEWGRQRAPQRVVFSLLTNHHKTPVEYARNLLVRDFLETSADRLWFIDADMIPRHDVFRIFDVDADLVCGRAHSYQDEYGVPGGRTGIKIEARKKNADDALFTNILPTPGQSIVQQVDACGGACLLIKRRVFEHPGMMLPTAYQNGDGEPCDLNDEKGQQTWAPPFFRSLRKPNGELLRGEDIDFTYRATQLGFTLKVDIGAEIGHFKTIDIDGVERAARQAIQRHLAYMQAQQSAEVASHE
jgi:hypothetical protein